MWPSAISRTVGYKLRDKERKTWVYPGSLCVQLQDTAGQMVGSLVSTIEKFPPKNHKTSRCSGRRA